MGGGVQALRASLVCGGRGYDASPKRCLVCGWRRAVAASTRESGAWARAVCVRIGCGGAYGVCGGIGFRAGVCFK